MPLKLGVSVRGAGGHDERAKGRDGVRAGERARENQAGIRGPGQAVGRRVWGGIWRGEVMTTQAATCALPSMEATEQRNFCTP
jgi:hypothetical protein